MLTIRRQSHSTTALRFRLLDLAHTRFPKTLPPMRLPMLYHAVIATYDNQEAVGRGIKESGINREDIFITSKVWVTDMDGEKTMEACQKTIQELNVEYLDLYLIHWPKPNSRHCYQIMQQLCEKKLVKSIGISNFKPHHMEEFIKGEPIVPVINQIECHPYLQQEDTILSKT